MSESTKTLLQEFHKINKKWKKEVIRRAWLEQREDRLRKLCDKYEGSVTKYKIYEIMGWKEE